MESTSSELALDLHDVQKVYGHGRKRVHALRGVSVQVHRGEIFGLLGPNGAGKSTLVKILMTVIRADHVEGTLLGRPVGHKPTLAKVGYLPEHHRFPRYLTGRQMLEFFGALSGTERSARKRRSAELLDQVGMGQWGDRRIDSYSKGMMQRVGIAQALVNDPNLVVLDEPTDGVDPIGRQEIRNVLLRLREEGRTVFVNSHLLSELEMISDRVAIMVGGEVVQQGTMNELARHDQWFEFEVTPETATPVVSLMPVNGKEPLLKGQGPDGVWVEVERMPDRVTLRLGISEPSQAQETLDRLRAAGCVIRRMGLVRPSLEELFMKAVKSPGNGQVKL